MIKKRWIKKHRICKSSMFNNKNKIYKNQFNNYFKSEKNNIFDDRKLFLSTNIQTNLFEFELKNNFYFL